MIRAAVAIALAFLFGAASPPPVEVEPDAPALAAPGPHGAGVMQRTVVGADQLDPFASVAAGHAVLASRTLSLRIWYPAKPGSKARRVTYSATLTSEPPLPPAAFTIHGNAVENAPAGGTGFPIVVLSHGYDNDPVMMRWLGENLATKGYVVLAIAHRDPPITDPSGSVPTLLRRPLDITLVLKQLRAGLLGPLVDPSRIALAGYSFGGFGVMTAAGARLDPTSPMVARLPAPLLADYAADGPKAGELHDLGVKAVVAIAPAGGAPWSAWGAGLKELHAPLLILAGSVDRVVGYDPGPASIFAAASGSDRFMVTFSGAGHAIGTDPLPGQMRNRLWDMDWFEDPVWRKPRLNAISLHFITAFLDLHLKADAAKAEYLAVPQEKSDGAMWKGATAPYAAISQGGENPTWKGFIRNHQNGLTLRHMMPEP
jgi:predicted dienelactone hydrolase